MTCVAVRRVTWVGNSRAVLRSLSKPLRLGFGRALYLLQTDPIRAIERCDIQKMSNVEAWRIRIDGWRLFYFVGDDEICVYEVSPRKTAYR